MTSEGPFVCTECIDDSGIRGFIEANNVKSRCSFCEATDSIAALLDEVTEHMKDSLEYEYDDALNWFVYDSEEGDYIGETWDSWDLLTEEIELDLPNDYNGILLRKIIDRLPQRTWCQADPYDVPGLEKVRYDWAWFSEVIMHRRRFFFENYESQPDSGKFSLGAFLEKVFHYAENYELFQLFPSRTKLFRARYQQPDTRLTSAEELGPPPKDRAVNANRMSPPGISMFYGCDYVETALRETAKTPGSFAVGCFETRRAATILDLTKIPPVPSIFELISERLGFRPREVLGFLNHVADEVSKPAQQDGRVHIDYIPTQVVTEFVRSKLTQEEARIDGIKYWSAVHPGYASYVIFAGQENLSPAPEEPPVLFTDRWLELTYSCERNVLSEDIERWKREVPEPYQRDYRLLLYGDD